MALFDEKSAGFALDSQNNVLRLFGLWTIKGIEKLDIQAPILKNQVDSLIVDGSDITLMDSAGAWEIQKFLSERQILGKQSELKGFQSKHKILLDLVLSKSTEINKTKIQRKSQSLLYIIGKAVVEKTFLLLAFIDFIGEVVLEGLYNFIHPRRIQIKSILHTIDETGHQALPIIGLLSFLIGMVLAYQMGLQLKLYGANIFIVQISGMAVLREFAPLITAIIMAGRTTSAFTAQIGTMKVNEEIDALRTMGLSPVNRLVLPKLMGTVIATPLLTVWAMFFGMLGSMVMARMMLGINFYVFLLHFRIDVALSNYVVGLIKTPVFALIVAGVGCFRGFQVQASADSVGHQTTKSVVQAIFLIIIADAIFSIIFSSTGI